MKLLQLVFSRDFNGGFNCKVNVNNTNFCSHYYGPGSPESLLTNMNSGILINMISFITNKLCIPAKNKIAAPINVPLGDYEMQVVMAQVFDRAMNGNLECEVTAWQDSKTSVTFRQVDGDTPPLTPDRLLIMKFTRSDYVQHIRNLVPTESPLGQMAAPAEKKAGKPTCRNCGRAFSTGEVPLSTGEKVALCNDCKAVTECALCKFPEPQMYCKSSIEIDDETAKNKYAAICRKCANTLTHCRGCAKYFDTKKEEICPCRVKSDFKTFINGFNDDVLKYYKKDMFSNELYGIEIEVGTPNTNRRKFPEIVQATNEIIANNAILKYDSSIDFINKAENIDNSFKGFEMVTRPMMYKNAARYLKSFCKGIHPALRSWEVGTCGLHIHVSKACLRPIEIGKILKFINNKGNRPFIRMIAKREDKKYAKYLPKRLTDWGKSTIGANGIPQEHYEAINTSKPYTIEFRIFRGTLNPHTVISYLQFVKSVIEFVRISDTNDETLTYQHYVDFLFSTEKSRFRELKDRIRTENLKEIAERGEI